MTTQKVVTAFCFSKHYDSSFEKICWFTLASGAILKGACGTASIICFC